MSLVDGLLCFGLVVVGALGFFLDVCSIFDEAKPNPGRGKPPADMYPDF